MSADFVSTHIQRGLHLRRVRRFAEAEAAFKEALSTDPENDFALHHLATCQWQQEGREKDALRTIREAVRVAPNDSDHHALAALIRGNVESAKDALPSADEAIRLDPSSAFAFYARSQLLLALRRLPEAEVAARSALEREPGHSGAATVLSHTLRLQGRTGENAAQIAAMLERDPEDDEHHAAAGWNALQAGKYTEAQTHFREALRLNPESEFARDGLIEAFRARSTVYRIYLRWALWMQGKGDAFQWSVIIGFYLLAKFSRVIFSGPFAPIAALLVGLYFLFVLWVHVAKAVGNFMLLWDPFARLALRRPEKLEAWIVGVFVIGAVGFGAVGALTGSFSLLFLAGTLLAAAIPFSHTFTNKAPAGRWLFGGIGVYVLIAGTIVLCADWLLFIDAKVAVNLAVLGMLLSVFSTWLSNWRAVHR
jgi:tetratricopeptide (TPR) repeat protein